MKVWLILVQGQEGAAVPGGPTSQPSVELQPRFPSQPSGIAALLNGVKQEQFSPDKEAAAASSLTKQEDGAVPKEEGVDQQQAEQPPATLAERHAGLPEDMKALLLEHTTFLQKSGAPFFFAAPGFLSWHLCSTFRLDSVASFSRA